MILDGKPVTANTVLAITCKDKSVQTVESLGGAVPGGVPEHGAGDPHRALGVVTERPLVRGAQVRQVGGDGPSPACLVDAPQARIRILELLAGRERTVQELREALALEQPVVSQHLAALRARQLVQARREGTAAHYGLRSPLIADLLRVAREFLNHQLTASQSLLRELRREDRRS